MKELPAFLQELKDLLSDITAEANVETSLDLTLAKDINEIITQLQEAVENTDKIIEEMPVENIVVDVLASQGYNIKSTYTKTVSFS